MTWQELIQNALIELGVKVPNEALDPSDISLGMARVKLLLERWSMSGLVNYGITRQSHTVTAEKSTFTIGVAQDNDIQLEQLNQVNVVTFAPHRSTEERPLTLSNFVAIEQSTSRQSGIPTYYYYEFNFPSAKLHFDRNLQVDSRFTLVGPSLLSSDGIEATDQIAMPPGYKEALLYNIAVMLAPSYGVKNDQLAANTLIMANDTLKMLKVRNSRPLIPLADHSNLGVRSRFIGA